MKNLTKIIATIGPSSDSKKTIEKLILRGVTIFRFNLKHNTVAWHSERIKRVNKIAGKLNTPIGTMVVLQGSEIRIKMPVDQIKVEKDERIEFGEHVFKDQSKGFSITYPDIINQLTPGATLLADDGMFYFTVERKNNNQYLISHTTGVLKNKKSINIPGSDFTFPTLVERDFESLQLASREEVDFISISFVSTAKDIIIVRNEMEKYKLKAKVVAKIEMRKALDNLDEIIDVSDAIMVARGDLGVEIPYEQVPYYQKIVINKCIERGVPVITATQMLQSMITSPRPTRAEISDIANAAYDLTDAVMLSAETATGKYPLKAVDAMRKTVAYNEKLFNINTKLQYRFRITDNDGLLCDAAYNLYIELLRNGASLKGFLVFSKTGRTVRLLSRYRPLQPIFAFAPKEVCESLTINFGVLPCPRIEILKKREVANDDVLVAIKFLKNKNIVKKGDTLIALHGDYWAVTGGTSTVKLVTCQ